MLKRFGRILFTSLAALSLLLCIATCGLWVRSYQSQPGASYSDRWMRDNGYSALDHGTFVWVKFDKAAPPQGYYYYSLLVVTVSRWMGGSGWNNLWVYHSVHVSLLGASLLFLVLPVCEWLALKMWPRRERRGFEVAPVATSKAPSAAKADPSLRSG